MCQIEINRVQSAKKMHNRTWCVLLPIQRVRMKLYNFLDAWLGHPASLPYVDVWLAAERQDT
jgi:hypothetical protein